MHRCAVLMLLGISVTWRPVYSIDCGESSLTVNTDDMCLTLSPLVPFSRTPGSIIRYSCATLLTGLQLSEIDFCPVEICQINGTWSTASLSCAMNECFPRGQSEAYKGRRKCTVNGHACESWRNHGFLGQDHAYCRDPGGEKGAPWCHVTAKSVPATWEYCDVPICDDKRLDTQRCNEEYIESCALPDMKVKVDHDCTGIESLPVYSTDVGSTMHFRCSYIQANIRSSRDYCPVQVCQRDGLWTAASISCGENECYESGRSDEYRGHRSCTRSGRQCQAWNSQYPHTHDLQAGSFPGENMTGSYCRDPNGMRGAPWCFTLDPKLEWEDCSIDLCNEIELVSTKCSSFSEQELAIGHPSDKFLYQSNTWDQYYPFLLGPNKRSISPGYTLHSNTHLISSHPSQISHFKTVPPEQSQISISRTVPSHPSHISPFQPVPSHLSPLSYFHPVPHGQSLNNNFHSVSQIQYPISYTHPVPSEQYPISYIHPVPSEQYPISYTHPVPTEQYPISYTHPVPTEQYPISYIHPVPSEQYPISYTHPVPTEQYPISYTHPVPSEQYLISNTHPVPSEQYQISYTHPVPTEQYPISYTHPVPTEQYLISNTHPVPSEQYQISYTHPVPTEQYPISYTQPVPTEQYPISYTHPVPTEQYSISYTHPVPSEQYLISNTHPVPSEQYPISNIHTVPSEQYIISNIHTVPSEQYPISNTHPVPPEQYIISNIHTVPSEQYPISNTHPVPSEQYPISNSNPVLPEQYPISNFHTVLSEYALNSGYQHAPSEQILQNSFQLPSSQTVVHINDQPKSIEQNIYSSTQPVPSKHTPDSIIRSTGGRIHHSPYHSSGFFITPYSSSGHTRLEDSYILDKNLVTQLDKEDDMDTWPSVQHKITEAEGYESAAKISFDFTTYESASVHPQQSGKLKPIISSSKFIGTTSELGIILKSTYTIPAVKFNSVRDATGEARMFLYRSSSIPDELDLSLFRTKNSVIQDQVLSTLRSSRLFLGILTGTQMVDTTVRRGSTQSDNLFIDRSDGNSQASVHVSKEISKDINLIATFYWSKSSFMTIAGISTSHSGIGMAVTDSVNRDTASADSTQGTDNVEQYEGISIGISNTYERLLSLDSNMPLGQDRLASTPEPITTVHMKVKEGTTTTKDDDSTLFYSIQPSYLPIPGSILTATSPLPTTDAADKSAILSSMKPVKTAANLNNADRSSMFNMEDAAIRANVHTLNGNHIIDKSYNNSSTSSGFSLRPPNLLPAMDAVPSANSPIQNVSGYKATETTSWRSSSSVNTTKNTSFVVEPSASTVIAGDEAKEILTQHKIVPYKCLVDLNFAERARRNFKLNVWTFRQATAYLSKLSPLSGNLHRKNGNEISCGRHCSHVYKCDMFAFDFETNMCALFSLETGEIHLDCTEHERLSCYARCITGD